MIGENIKMARAARELSQEEVAVKLGVVRQTVSKWEKGLSVPDADLLVQLSHVLDVPVHELLGVEKSSREVEEERKRTAQANQKRGLILFLSFASMLVMLAVKNEVVSILLASICIVTALLILYRDLTLLSKPMTKEQLRPLRIVTVFDLALLVIVVGIVFLNKTIAPDLFSDGGRTLAMAIIIVVMIFCEIISPRLPFNCHTGLRLPWTIRDEDAWTVAHQVLGQISLPLALLYLAVGITVPYFEITTFAIMILWVGIPGVLSYLCFWRKYHKK